MSFPRHNNYEVMSESLSRFRDHHHEIGGDSTYQMPRRDESDYPTRFRRRCLSPEPQRLQLTRDGDGRIRNSMENSDCDWGFSIDRNRHKQMRSRSPQFGLVKTKPQVNDGDSRRDSQYTGASSERYVERGYMDEEENYNDIRGLKPDYLLDNTRTTRENFFHGSKLKNSGQYRRLSDELIRRPTDTLSNHGERGEQHYAPSKESSETRYYPEIITADKSSDMESHKDGDNPVTYSRDASYYPHVVPSKANGGDSFHYKDLEGTSSTTLRPNFSTSYMNGMPSCEDEYSRDPGKVVGGLGSTSYGLNCQSYLSDLRGDSEIAHNYLGGYKRDINAGPVRREGRGDLINRNGREIDGLGYPSDECRRVGSEDQVDHKQDDFFRPGIRDTARTHFDTRDDRYGYLRSEAREHSTMKKQVDSVYSPGVSKLKAVSEIGKEFADLGSPYSQHDQRISRDHEVFHSDIMYDHDISPSWKSQYRFGRETDFNSHVESRRNLTSDFGFGRDAVPDYNSESVREFTSNVDADSYTERIRELPCFKYEDEMDVLTVSPCKPHQREREAKEDLTHRRMKSKYLDDQQMNIHNSRKVIWSDAHDAYNRVAEWNDEDLDVQIPSRRLYDKNKSFQRKKRVFDRLVECEYVTHKDVLSSNDHHLQNHSGIHSRLGNGPSKGLPWLGSLGHISKKKKPYKPDNVWINEEDNGRAGTIINDEPSKGLPWLGSLGHIGKKKRPNVWIKEIEDNGRAGTVNNDEPNKSERFVTSKKKSEPPEDSEEFKKLVNKAFLSFSKKLNENPSNQTSYKEQGRVGSLLCIVCGRSESKKFMDTKQLAAHAFTSGEVGLRAQHLGLHKAICVLLGWQSVVTAPDINLYIPEPVSEEEALAQKEDLILWPPVVIVHTTSVSQDKSKLNIVDAVTEFLRGKGIGGNFKASLGRSANTVVLKYLGIFSNLQNAKRIEKYFLDNKRGRADFERVVSSNKCSSTTISSSNDGDDKKKSGSKEEEEANIYYGYMGISEDLDIIDLETMNKCMIKSKKEIQDLAHASIIMPRI